MSSNVPIPDTQLSDPPWDRAEGESDPAYGAFLRYRDMGLDRSLAKVATELGKSTTLMERWSVRWLWRKRVEAWDSEEDVKRILANNDAIERMAARHASQASGAIQALMIPHLALARRLRDDQSLIELMSTGSITELLNLAMRTATGISSLMQAERLARGAPTEIRHTREDGVKVELTAELSDDDYQEIAATLVAALGPGQVEDQDADPDDADGVHPTPANE